MARRALSDITLSRQGTTLVYVDTSVKQAGWAYWLAVPPKEPPPTMTLVEAWTTNLGYVLFIDKTPSSWSTLEKDLASALDPKPAHTSFGWVKTAKVSRDWVVAVNKNETVGADVPVAPPGLPCLDIKAGTPVSLDASGPSGGGPVIALSHPPIPAHGNQPPADPPSGPGVSIALTTSVAGAAKFQLLQGFPEATEQDAGSAVVKPIFDAVFDPLHPARTKFTYTGTDIVVSEIDGVFSIAAP
jgi:hypothetical protein